MESLAINSVGIVFQRLINSTFEGIAEIVGIDGPSENRDFIDTTTLSTIDGYSEFVASFKDGGNVSLKMNFTNSTYDLMNDDFEDENKHSYQIYIPNEDFYISFNAILVQLGLGLQVGDLISSDVELKVTGNIDFYVGTLQSDNMIWHDNTILRDDLLVFDSIYIES